jgi:hypothetical protein
MLAPYSAGKGAMNEEEGLDRSEVLVLDSLEDSPRPCGTSGLGRWSLPQQKAGFLGPALVSLVARGLVEVRGFDNWPARWDHGTPVARDYVLFASGRVEAWSGDSTLGVLAAHLTKAGIRYL